MRLRKGTGLWNAAQVALSPDQEERFSLTQNLKNLRQIPKEHVIFQNSRENSLGTIHSPSVYNSNITAGSIIRGCL